MKAINEAWPPLVATVLCAATLTPLVKKDAEGKEGTRPIAAGETLRRLVGKSLMRNPDVSRQLHVLSPSQCGVGVSGACGLLSMGLSST